jgi:hypothetical protein
MTDAMYFGRSEILRCLTRLGICSSWRSVQRRKKAGTLLLRYTPEGQPFILEKEILQQKIKQSEIILEKS